MSADWCAVCRIQGFSGKPNRRILLRNVNALLEPLSNCDQHLSVPHCRSELFNSYNYDIVNLAVVSIHALFRGATMKLRHPRLVGFLLSITLTIVGLEAILSLDPLGMVYWRDLTTSTQWLQPTPYGATYIPGNHALSHSSFTMLKDGTRQVPETNVSANHTLLILGDSVAFGWGVNDAETWANLVARQLPDWRVINAAIPGFNTENVRLALTYFSNQYSIDQVAYQLTSNDADVTISFHTGPKEIHFGSWLADYVGYFTYQQPVVPVNYDRFDRDIVAIASDPRVLIVAVPSPCTTEAQNLTRVFVFPAYTGRNSYADGHPNALGHQQIANALLPVISARIGDPGA